jgi:hypothetical protein
MHLSPPQMLLLAMITVSIEIHFTTLYMADLGTRAEPLGEGAQRECMMIPKVHGNWTLQTLS